MSWYRGSCVAAKGHGRPPGASGSERRVSKQRSVSSEGFGWPEVAFCRGEGLLVLGRVCLDSRGGPPSGGDLVRVAVDGQLGRVRQRGDQLLREGGLLGW